MPSASRNARIASLTSASSRPTSLGPLFDDRHSCAKATVDLRELQPDVAAADDHKLLRQHVGREQRTVGQIGDVRNAGQFGYQRAAAHIDEYALRLDAASSPHARRAGVSNRACPSSSVQRSMPRSQFSLLARLSAEIFCERA